MKQRGGAIFSIIVLALILWQARQPLWNGHLQVDIWVWWERINYWLTYSSFSGLKGNEILPATLAYFFTPLLLIPVGWASYGNYLPATLTLNLLIVATHIYLVYRQMPAGLAWLLGGILAIGPILLFRFDPLVTLLAVGGVLLWQQKRWAISGFMLGWATAMKVFPVIFIPYLGFLMWQKRQWRPISRFGIYFVEGLIVPIIIFFLLGGNWEQVVEALSFHEKKLISIESLPGTIITGWNLIVSGMPPQPIPGYGIWAVAGEAQWFNRLWWLPVALIYYFIVKLKSVAFSWQVPLCLMLAFLFVNKNLNPQYLWWYMAILPFTRPSRLIGGLTLIVAGLNQLVYPIFYTTLIEDFYQNNQSYWVYYLLVLRNLGIGYLTWLTLKTWYLSWSRVKGKLSTK